jgi:hypothetical protein
MNFADNFKLNENTGYIYTLFMWTASNCSPNRDGGTGEIRVDAKRRVFTTQECFNQNVKNGVYFSSQSGAIPSEYGSELLGCKNAFFRPTTLKNAQMELLNRIGSKLEKAPKELTTKDLFFQCFDIPLFGTVNSDGIDKKEYPAFDFHSITGSAGLIYLPKTVTQVSIENRGISNAFAGENKDMPGSHYTDYMVEGVFSCLGFFNVFQLELIAEKIFKISDKTLVRKRIEELYRLYLAGVWEGFKLLGYASTMRKGQQPYCLYSAQRKDIPNYILDPADLLMKNSIMPSHVSFDKTLKDYKEVCKPWMKKIALENDWQEIEKADI